MNFFRLTLTAALLLSTFLGVAQNFEGSIRYKITYLEVPKEVEGMESMLPSEMVMYFSGSKVRLEQEVMGGSQIVLTDNNTKASSIMMDMMGQKIVINLSPEEIAAAEAGAEEPKIEHLDGSKEILGYTCDKVKLTDTATGTVTTLYYTKKIDVEHSNFKALDGFPLEYEAFENGMHLRITATSVDKKKVPESMFLVPAGYTEMTMEELQQMGQ